MGTFEEGYKGMDIKIVKILQKLNSTKFRIGPSKYGCGLIATQGIMVFEHIYTLTEDQTKVIKVERKYLAGAMRSKSLMRMVHDFFEHTEDDCVLVERGAIDPINPIHYINHSPKPNSRFTLSNGVYMLVARRTINEGEEITADYRKRKYNHFTFDLEG
jgi:hypothetical protein